jgi:hypothetical protein
MTALPWHPSQGLPAHSESAPDAPDIPGDDLMGTATAPITNQRADCCIAAAAYLVVLPAGRTRPHAGELLLCAHHYRVSAENLVKAHAVVYDATHHRVTSGRW